MTARLPFTELAVRRAIAAARKEGIRVTGVTIAPDGTISVGEIPVAPTPPQEHSAASSEFEDFKA